MAYINIETNQYPLSEDDIRALSPNVSFAQPFYPPEQYAVVFPTPIPQVETILKIAQEIAPQLTSKGVWEQRWEVVDRFKDVYNTEDGTLLYTKQQQEQAAVAREQEAKLSNAISTAIAQAQDRLDQFAKTRGYDDIKSLVTYVDDPNPKFAAEGAYGKLVRSQTWTSLSTILAEIEAGTRPIPTSFAEIESELPVLQWPEISL